MQIPYIKSILITNLPSSLSEYYEFLIKETIGRESLTTVITFMSY